MTRARCLAVLLVALAACNDDTVTFTPVIDLPITANASAFPLDQLLVEVAHDGDTLDLNSAKFGKGQTVSIGGVPFASDIVVHLTGYVGMSPVAYGRSCAVAVSPDSVPQPHLYFSRSVKFSEVAGRPTDARVGGIALTYHDGAGVIVGGVSATDGSAVTQAEEFDPNTGELTDLAQLMPRVGAAAAVLGTGNDGQIAVIGGLDPSTSMGAQFVELVEADAPEPRRVQTIADTNMARIGLTATALSDGRVLAIGGRSSMQSVPGGDVDVITTENGTAVVRALRAMLVHPRYAHTATRLADDVGAPVLVAGGLDGSTPSGGVPVAQAELFKPLSEDFSATFTYSMATPRSQHQALRMPDGSVLIIGGVGADGKGVTSLEVFTQDAGFVALGDLPTTAGLVDFTATTLPDGRVLLTGGRLTPGGPPVASAFIVRLDSVNGMLDVVATDNLVNKRAGHQATLLCDGTVLITGGEPAPGQPTNEIAAERYNPPPDGRR